MSWSDHIKILGQGNKSLVFFHGWGFDNSIWQSMADKLQGSFRLYLVNLPGFGQSPLLSWEDFKERLLICLPQKFALVGWSMGGLYATRLAHEAKSRVSHLMNIGSTPYFMMEKDWPGIRQDAMQSFYDDVIRDPLACHKKFTKETSRLASPQQLPALLAGLQILSQWDMRDCLANISCPIYYLFGRLDTIVPRTTYQVMKTKYPQCQYQILGRAAHDPFVSHQADCIHAIEGFVQ